jgi:predicted metal-dependent enzyme (double-stranded beta helix superfamily)
MEKSIKWVIKSLEKLDWKNLEKVTSHNKKLLEYLFNNRKIINLFLKNVLKDETLISLAEHYDFFDKIVLYADKKERFRIRLHIFSGDPSTKYRPHCHRWNYSSVILKGSYTHFIYGTETHINEETDLEDLKPIIIQEENQGSIYTLSHKVFHSIEAKPDTVSIIIRGPAVKDRFLIMDKLTGRKWWEYGRGSETIEEIKRKLVSIEHIKNLIDKLYKLKVLE